MNVHDPLERMRSLGEILKAIHSAQSMAEAAQFALPDLRRLIPCQLAGIVQTGPERVICVGSDFDPGMDGLALWPPSLESLVLPPELWEGEVLYAPDTNRVSENFEYVDKLKRRGVRSFMLVYLISDARITGAMVLFAAAPDAFSKPAREMALSIADQLSIVADRIMLRAQLEQRAAELEKTLHELRKAQEQLVRQERLHALGTMASGIAHDLNNALSPILGYSDLLLDFPENLEDREKRVRFLKIISTAARDAGSIVGKLREFYRNREKNDPVSHVNLESVITQSVALTRHKWENQAMERGARIRIHANVSGLPPVLANEIELREAFTNLIINAVDAMPEGGGISITGSSGEKSVRLEFEDTGTGMTDEVRQRCLEPFFTTKGEHGSGLGLSVIYGIVQRHGGEMEIESEPGKGTIFKITLPVGKESASPRAGTGEPAPPRPLRILLVDDDPRALDVVQELLLSDGHTVTTAQRGMDGLKLASSENFDVVILDQGMPEMSGDVVAATLKQSNRKQPIILLTGFSSPVHDSSQAGKDFDLVLSKPVTLTALRLALSHVSGGTET